MEKLKLTDSVISMTGRRVKADRTVCKETVTYEPHGSSGATLDVNTLVYELMVIAAYDVLDLGTVVYGGSWTAAELAGKVGYLHMFVENTNEHYECPTMIRIHTKTFDCSFHVGEAFSQMTEWEGVAGIAPSKAYKFHCAGKEMPKGAKIEPYKRCHGYKPTTISMVPTERRINQKFEVLGKLYQSLTSEGMRKAMSVCAAARLFDNKNYEVRMTMLVAVTVNVEAENAEAAEKLALEKTGNDEAFYLHHYDSVWEREVIEVNEDTETTDNTDLTD